MRVLVILDIQNDFCPGGALEVPEGDAIIPVVNELQGRFDLVVATQDWHPPNHTSFASNHKGKKIYDKIELFGLEQVLWPDHCVQNSVGAQLHPQLNQSKIEAIFRKGMNPEIDSYSGIYDNAHRKKTGLAGYLRDKGASKLYFCGLTADYCVYYSIKDALMENFSTLLIEDATMALNQQEYIIKKEEIIHKGAQIVRSSDLF